MAMRYRLRTLLILAIVAGALVGPLMVVLAAYIHWALIALGWAVFGVIFAVWYWMLLKSLANPKMRGEQNYLPPHSL
jgi:predicted MFS family arabinose efflux permease